MNLNNEKYNPAGRSDKNALIAKINDAADGLLSPAQIQQLESDLRSYPRLLEDYRAIMSLPDAGNLFGTIDDHRDPEAVQNILHQIDQQYTRTSPFEDFSLYWFKKYALAASVLFIAAISIFYGSQSGDLNGDITYEELFYPQLESSADAYVFYLEEWIE